MFTPSSPPLKIDIDTRTVSLAVDLDLIDQSIGNMTLSMSEDERIGAEHQQQLEQLEALVNSLESIARFLESQRGQGLEALTVDLLSTTLLAFETRSQIRCPIEHWAIDDAYGTVLAQEGIKDYLEMIWEKIVSLMQHVKAFLLKFWNWIVSLLDKREQGVKAVVDYTKDPAVKQAALPAMEVVIDQVKLIEALTFDGQPLTDIQAALERLETLVNEVAKTNAAYYQDTKNALKMITEAASGKQVDEKTLDSAFSKFEKGLFNRIDENTAKTLPLPFDTQYIFHFHDHYHVEIEKKQGTVPLPETLTFSPVETDTLTQWCHHWQVVATQLKALTHEIIKQEKDLEQLRPVFRSRALNVKTQQTFDRMVKEFKYIETQRLTLSKTVVKQLAMAMDAYAKLIAILGVAHYDALPDKVREALGGNLEQAMGHL